MLFFLEKVVFVSKIKMSNKEMSKVLERSEMTWVLDKFSKIKKKWSNGNYLKSGVFPDYNSKRKCDWRLIIYPNGESVALKNTVSFYVQLLSELNYSVSAKYIICFQNSNDELILKKEEPYKVFEETNKQWGYKSLIKCEEIMSAIGEDDILKIHVVILREVLTLQPYHVLSTQKEKQTSVTLLRGLGNQLKSGEFSDFVVIFDDDTEIAVNRNILAAISPVFTAMFKYDVSENKCGSVKITDIDKITMVKLINFAYTGDIGDLSTNEAAELIAAADKYQIPDLIERCSEVLEDNIKVTNVLDFLLLAGLHNAPKLKQTAFNYVLANFWKFTDSKKLEKVGKCPNLLAELVSKIFVLSKGKSEVKLQ